MDNSQAVLMVQADWHIAVEEGDPMFWISATEADQVRLKSQVKIGKDRQTLTAEDDRFVANMLSEGKLRILYKPSNTEAVFIAPEKAFPLKCNKALDVNHVQTGILSDSTYSLKVWDCVNGNIKFAMNGHKMDISCAKFFPSGLVVLSGSADMCLKVWSLETRKCHRTFIGHKRGINDIGFLDRGKQVISCSDDGSLRIWNCSNSACLSTPLQVLSELTNLSQHESFIAITSSAGALHLVDIRSNDNTILQSFSSPLNVVEFVDENHVAVGGESVLAVCDLRQQNKAIWQTTTKFDVTAMKAWRDGFWVGLRDGCVHYVNNSFRMEWNVQLTGSNCDVIYAIAVDSNHIYTTCRDDIIRTYLIPN